MSNFHNTIFLLKNPVFLFVGISADFPVPSAGFFVYNVFMKERIKKSFGELPIKKKMFLAIIPAILLLVVVFFGVFRIMITSLRENAIKTNFQLISLIEKDIESELSTVRNSASAIITDEKVKAYAASNSTDADKKRLVGSSKSLQQTSRIPSYMVIRSSTDYVFSHVGKFLSESERRKLASFAYEHYNEITGPFVLSSDSTEMLYMILSLADSAREHRGIFTGALLVVGNSRSFLSNIAANYSLGQNMIIYDGFGNKICGTPVDGSLPVSLMRMTGEDFISYQDPKTDTLYLGHHLKNYNWNIIIQQPLSTITEQMNHYRRLFLIVAAISIALAFTMISIISSFFTKRLSEMTTVIQSIQEGDIDCRYPVRYQDEISTIGNEFNKMFDEIQTYQITATQQSLRQREAELHALQSQINPHFLYNSLDCIRSEALVNDDNVTADQIQTLANMFRYTVGKSDSERLVPISAEISHVNDYLDMLKYRFRDRFTFTVSIPKEVMSFMTPKLILQPVVENSFTHGIRNMASGGKIVVSASLENMPSHHIFFTVTDNGCGIPEDRLGFIGTQLSAPPLTAKETPFMGLVNTNDRIRLAFGTEYGITIQSTLKEGTRVEIRIPIIEQNSGEIQK